MANKKEEILSLTADFLDEKKGDIAKAWLSRKEVVEVFAKYGIDRKKFHDSIATEIIGYFVKVLKKEESVGRCPAMNRFVSLMFEKNISVKEVFLVCMELRQALFHLIITNGKVDIEDPWLFETLSGTLDKNLSGVLEYYVELVVNEKLEEQQEENDRDFTDRIMRILDLQENAIFKIRGNRLYLANRAFYETVGVDDIESFSKEYQDIWSFIQKVYSFQDLFQEHKYDEWISRCIKESGGKCEAELFDHKSGRKAHMVMTMRAMPKGRRSEYVISMEDITDQKAKLASMTHMIYTDALTLVPNRRKFDQVIAAFIKRYKDSKKPFYLLLVDIHNLTDINESLGRDAGDLILKRFAKRVLDNMKNGSFFARLDGDRFALLVADAGHEKAMQKAKDILLLLHGVLYREDAYAKGNIAVVKSYEEDSVATMLSRGDRLVQQIKERGGDEVVDDLLMIEEDRKVKKAAETFLERCRNYLEEKKPLDVVNYYLEVPIDSKGEIVKILGDLVWVKLRKVALHTIRRNGEIYIKMEEKPHIKAVVEDLDKERLWVRLGGFEPVMHSPLDRKSFHVKLLPPLEGILHKESISVPIDIETISVDSITVSMTYMTQLAMEDSIEIETVLRWGDMEKKVRLTGVIRKIEKSKFAVKMVVSLSSVGKMLEETLTQFVAHRQIEIIKEIKESIF